MQITKLKRFAQEARNILLRGVAQRLAVFGITADGINERPQKMGGGAVFQGKTVDLDFVRNWEAVAHQVETRSFREAVEEAAFTWFNRLVAIRIMAKNGLVAPILDFESEEVHIPMLVSDARQGRLPQLTPAQSKQWQAIANNDSLTDEQFAILIQAWCNTNPIIKASFGTVDEYTSLLLPTNILKDDGFVNMLNHTDYISDDDYRSPELIGWLYQFYISERKDEVFAKKGKYDTDEIPAATQIFTPNWIVKYMVQNTVGRLYLDANPWETEIQKDWKYLVEKPGSEAPAEPAPMLDLEAIKVADLGCGSGHILNECLDLLYQLYLNEGYSSRDALTNIFHRNLVGADIDLRAKQLSTFALLLKACQYDSSMADAKVLPQVLEAPLPFSSTEMGGDDGRAYFPHFFLGNSTPTMFDELAGCFKLMENAKDLGSIIKFTISAENREALLKQVEHWESQPEIPHGIAVGLPYMRFILALTDRYDAIVMNPPYMGASSFNNILSNYVKSNYSEGKSDLMTVFMQVAMKMTKQSGMWAMINLPSWMFIKSFEELREKLLSSQHIQSLLHLGRGIFGSDFGSVAFVIKNSLGDGLGVYRRLFKEHVQVRSVEAIQQNFLDSSYGLYTANQKAFQRIPGKPIGYWLSSNMLSTFDYPNMLSYGTPSQGMSTCDVNRFLKLWFEVSIIDTNINSSNKKWVKYNKGGNFRRWFGNREYVVLWDNDGLLLESNKAALRNKASYFKEFIAWSKLSALGTGFRDFEKDFLFDGAGGSLFLKENSNKHYLIGLLNTSVARKILEVLSPTINFNESHIGNIPVKLASEEVKRQIDDLVEKNIAISKQDWDAHETSWDFECNELMKIDLEEAMQIIEEPYDERGMLVDYPRPEVEKISVRMDLYKQKWSRLFTKLHRNEEELNRRFIEIYGLEDELTPDVPFDEVTILQQGEINHAATVPVFDANGMDGYQLSWNDDAIIRQFISYGMGCIMGRYSTDKSGLILASQGETEEDYYKKVYGCEKDSVAADKFCIDDDGIVPLMSINNELTDNAALSFKRWLESTLGSETLVENLNTIQQILGKNIETYFQKEFWKEHKRRYQNRPIYWLFSSKKGAFQCLVYMHRMDAYTPERIRTRYLLPHIDWLRRKKAELDERSAMLTGPERKELDSINKQIDECLEYHDRLHTVADAQQPINLDDGVVANYAKFGSVVSKL